MKVNFYIYTYGYSVTASDAYMKIVYNCTNVVKEAVRQAMERIKDGTVRYEIKDFIVIPLDFS